MLAIAYTNYSFKILKYEFRVQFIGFNTDFKANRNFWVKKRPFKYKFRSHNAIHV